MIRDVLSVGGAAVSPWPRLGVHEAAATPHFSSRALERGRGGGRRRLPEVCPWFLWNKLWLSNFGGLLALFEGWWGHARFPAGATSRSRGPASPLAPPRGAVTQHAGWLPGWRARPGGPGARWRRRRLRRRGRRGPRCPARRGAARGPSARGPTSSSSWCSPTSTSWTCWGCCSSCTSAPATPAGRPPPAPRRRRRRRPPAPSRASRASRQGRAGGSGAGAGAVPRRRWPPLSPQVGHTQRVELVAGRAHAVRTLSLKPLLFGEYRPPPRRCGSAGSCPGVPQAGPGGFRCPAGRAQPDSGRGRSVWRLLGAEWLVGGLLLLPVPLFLGAALERAWFLFKAFGCTVFAEVTRSGWPVEKDLED